MEHLATHLVCDQRLDAALLCTMTPEQLTVAGLPMGVALQLVRMRRPGRFP